MTTTTYSELADHIAGVLRGEGFRPNYDRIEGLVQEHKDAFIDRLLAEAGLQNYRDSAFIAHIRTIDDSGVIEVVIRHHAAVLEKLQSDHEPATVNA